MGTARPLSCLSSQAPPPHPFSLPKGETQRFCVGLSGALAPGAGLLLHSCMEEVEEGGAVLASVEGHTELGEVVLIEGSLNGL